MKRDHDVTVIAFAHDEADLAASRTLEEQGFRCIAVPHNERAKKVLSLPLLLTSKPMTLGVYGSRTLQAEVDRHVERADVAYAYSSSMGAFLLPHTIPWVMHFAELDSDKWRQYSRRKGFPMRYVYEREWLTLLAFERKLAAAARTNVFCTQLEEAVFQRDVPGRPSVVLRNGVDLEYYRPAEGEAEPGHLVFVGVMDYYPNVDGCVHFVREVLPRVRERHPKARFTIVGSRPSRQVIRLAAEPGVDVTGFVDDTRVYLRKAAVSVAPLRIARGIQNKVLEALAMGLPVVGTECATQGVAGQAGRDYLCADSAEDQARAISELLADPEKARKLGQRGRRLVEGNYDWAVTLAPLDDILKDCLQPPEATES